MPKPRPPSSKLAESLRQIAPGRLVQGVGGSVWEGPLTWQTSHGRHATASWVVGKLSGFSGALLHDGSRGNLFKPGDPDTGGWRRSNGEGGWIHGTVSVLDDDLIFDDLANQPRQRRFQTGTLPGDMGASREFAKAIADIEFAQDLYGALSSIGWHSERTGKEYWGTWRRAAEIVVGLRGLGECYTDFFLMGNEGELTVEVNEHLAKMGWTNLGLRDIEGRHRKALGILENCEQRPSGDTPEWYRLYGHGLSYGTDPDNRMHACAVSGRVSSDEWDTFWEFIDLDD